MSTIDLTPDRLDIDIYDGDGLAIEFDFVDGSNAAINYSGGTWAAGYKPGFDVADTSLISFSVDNSQANVGKITVTVSGANVALMAKTGVWDIQFTPTAGQPDTLYWGMMRKFGDVTP